MQEWMQEYPEFSADIKRADAVAEAAAIENIKRASRRSWYASAWWLERRHKGKWSANGPPEPDEDDSEPEDLVLGIDRGPGGADSVVIAIKPGCTVADVRAQVGLDATPPPPPSDHVADPES